MNTSSPNSFDPNDDSRARYLDIDGDSMAEKNSKIKMSISFSDNLSEDASLISYLAGYLELACEIQGIKSGQISLLITDDGEMSRLHEEHTGISGTTDILTFDLRDEPLDDGVVEVDIVLCLDEAVRQAASREHPLCNELLLYAIHGLLHVQGYDDHCPDDYRVMHCREDEILEQLGIGKLFDRQGKDK